MDAGALAGSGEALSPSTESARGPVPLLREPQEQDNDFSANEKPVAPEDIEPAAGDDDEAAGIACANLQLAVKQCPDPAQ